MNYIDSHTHNINSQFKGIYVVTDLNSPIPNKPFIVGIHPWYVDKFAISEFKKQFQNYASSKNFIALGEIGLDKSKADFDLQKKVFQEQVKLAIEFKIHSLVIHSVKSHAEILEILKENKFHGKILWHGINANIEQINQILKSQPNSWFGLGELLFKKSKISECLTKIPIERLLLETDDQTSFTIQDIYQKCANILSVDTQQLQIQIEKNFDFFVNKDD